jgi:hypothetical protein
MQVSSTIGDPELVDLFFGITTRLIYIEEERRSDNI